MSVTMPDYKVSNLKKRRTALIEEYEAASNQLNQELSSVNRTRLERQIAGLEAEIQKIDDQLAGRGDVVVNEAPEPRRQPVKGIPAGLVKPLRDTLLLCDEMLDPSAVRNLMTHEHLTPWRFSLPVMGSPQAQVGAVLNHLADQYRASGENALVVFLEVLAEAHAETQVGAQLKDLAGQLAAVK